MTSSKLDRIITFSLAMLTLIVFTGASVRLTQSGLGCEDWPGCSEESIIPEWELHGWTEFGNRILSALVGVAALWAAYACKLRKPFDQRIVRLAWWIVAGVAFQAILGAVTVFTELHPITVSAHFLISMVLITACVYLKELNKPSNNQDNIGKDPTVLAGLLGLGMIFGTLVTGTGPNSGDARSDRLDFDIESIARIHSLSNWLFVAFLAVLLYRHSCNKPVRQQLVALGTLSIAQGAIGYLQYELGVPPGIVLLHVIGATLLWLGVSFFHARNAQIWQSYVGGN